MGIRWKLLKAVQINDLNQVASLLAKGHDPNGPDADGNRPLHHAVGCDAFEIAKALLVAGADPNAGGFGGESPIMRARNVRMARLLIKYRADVNAVDNSGMTPLMQACNLDARSVVKHLIEKGADVNARSKNRATALIYGVYSRSMSMKKPRKGDIVELLLAAGADINAKDKSNMTALKVTQQCGCGSHGGMYADYLIQRGAK